jgi:hypothetical protein
LSSQASQKACIPSSARSFFQDGSTKEAQMPLFFLIAIGCGAFTVGATTVDVTTDARMQARDKANHTAQVQQVPPSQADVYTVPSQQKS